MKKNTKFLKMFFIVIMSIFIFANISMSNKVQALELNSREVEETLKSIIDIYGYNNMIFEDGITIELGEEVKISDFSDNNLNWTSYNNDILEVHEGMLITKNSGTTFIISESNSKCYIREVYVIGYDNVVEDYNLIDNFSSEDEVSEISSRIQPVVYIDPGHGGYDPGASGNGVIEKDIVLKVALKVKQKLEESGVKVIMSRSDDTFVSLQDRVILANAAGPDAFVSIHINSAGTTAATGIETYYYTSNSPNLASKLQNKLVEYTGAYNRGVKKDNFYVVTYTNMPSSLAEIGFLTNVNEANNLKNSSYQEKIANALTDGTLDFLNITPSVSNITASRIYGSTRYETSYEILKKGWKNTDYVVLASGLDYPDALCATPLATKYNAPIVLIANKSLSTQQELVNILKDKKVKNAFIVGGTGVISQGIENELKAMGISTTRLGGKDRYETSVAIAKKVGSNGEIALAYGLNFADGLSISSIAAKKSMPILLTNTNSLSDVVKKYISDSGINKAYIVGASGVISDSVAKSFSSYERLGGSDRYETNKKVFERFKSELNLNEMYIASSLDFADALSVSALAGKNSNFVLLSNLKYAEQSSISIIASCKKQLNNVYVLGSNLLITDNVLYKLGISTIK